MVKRCDYCKTTRDIVVELKTDWKEEMKELRKDVKNLANRLPTWATVVMTILVALLGYSIGSTPIR